MSTVSPRLVRGRVVTPTAVLEDGAVVWEGERLTWVGDAREAPGELREVVDAATPVAGYVLPGLVDLHCHGGGGASFPDAEDVETARVAVAEHLRHGTTSLVASLVTAAPQVLRQRTGVLVELAEAGEIAGIHYEGPFISADRCGAQNPAAIQQPDPALTRELLELGRGHVVTMTLAPEAPGVTGEEGVTRSLASGGALPSFGHTVATAPQARAAVVEAGRMLADEPAARSARPTVTHLCNGMNPMHHRAPGPIPEFLAAAADGRLVIELIADGTHLDPALVRSFMEIAGRENVALVTDAMAAAGMPDGDYQLGSLAVTVADGVARLTEGGSIAGGTAHLIDVVRTSVAGGVDLVDAVYAAATTPAAVLGDDGVGVLEAGRRADVVVTDTDLRPVRVVKGGVEL
ncbi:N-acetylglucosamine 6-phosphate deacetylase [Georgenia satyanarayanai]|uniref:N-acetylglucosamine 6-phosphate deacetylase n=1 Tax=Georgenia satyanarayanai TaxID=860221 RepID=A0A2Y9BWY6_9MICO|nr:amidohydrolase family protein [Georgenia satyanarayanai]PYG00503.1 N-acetylglucosamine 6-phosphate deacetylase [Georgenia satyanarayanai]SSA39892.1 N-acetylglucosamine 6-phosphate deacetylase [Georgenia satyanarayanai]